MNVVANTKMPVIDNKDKSKKALDENDKKKETQSSVTNIKNQIKESIAGTSQTSKRISAKEVYKVKEILNTKK